MNQTSATEIHAFLMDRHPKCFGTDIGNPMKIGILGDILSAHPGLDAVALSECLGRITSSDGYLRAVAAGIVRVDLDGAALAKPVPWHRAKAMADLGMPIPSRSPSTKRAGRKAGAILARMLHGALLTGPDADFVKSLVGFHPEAAAKTEGMVGIKAVKRSSGFGNFAIVRSDGSSELFSLAKCLAGHEAASAAAKLEASARSAAA